VDGLLPGSRSCVVVPIKRFAKAKKRLAGILSAHEREVLARSMAERVLQAAVGMAVIVVTDDDDVAAWATAHGASVTRDVDGGGLNGAVRSGIESAVASAAARVIVIHADIPLARSLTRFASVEPNQAVIVPDARYDGTNLLSIPTGVDLEFSYGAGSFGLHHRTLLRSGLEVIVAPDHLLGADVDHPRDLSIARAAGLWPLVG
jgi:2-phospho-L-lactate/phosphoenolpyruvate guanylyltransferase